MKTAWREWWRSLDQNLARQALVRFEKLHPAHRAEGRVLEASGPALDALLRPDGRPLISAWVDARHVVSLETVTELVNQVGDLADVHVLLSHASKETAEPLLAAAGGRWRAILVQAEALHQALGLTLPDPPALIVRDRDGGVLRVLTRTFDPGDVHELRTLFRA